MIGVRGLCHRRPLGGGGVRAKACAERCSPVRTWRKGVQAEGTINAKGITDGIYQRQKKFQGGRNEANSVGTGRRCCNRGWLLF